MSKPLIRIAISGASGRMGRQIIRAVQKTDGIVLSAALSRLGSSIVGVDAGELAGIGVIGIPISDKVDEIVEDFDVLLDFTNPKSTLRHLSVCLAECKTMVIGTTGFDDIQKQAILDASKHIGIVLSANFSVGVNLMIKLLEKVSSVIGESSDIEIIEAHHRHKIDAPSGTALEMGKAIANTLKYDLKECVCYAREGSRSSRTTKRIGFSTLRVGDVVGEHSAMFFGIGEKLEITHKASNSMIFANGALRAVRWIYKHDKGLFDMRDVLGLDNI